MSQNTKPYRVAVKSLPLSMRHADEDDALLQAEYLAQFLQEATCALLKDKECPPSEDCAYGLELTFNLLRDKLSVVSGWLKMPLASPLSDAPEWNPNAGRGDE